MRVTTGRGVLPVADGVDAGGEDTGDGGGADGTGVGGFADRSATGADTPAFCIRRQITYPIPSSKTTNSNLRHIAVCSPFISNACSRRLTCYDSGELTSERNTVRFMRSSAMSSPFGVSIIIGKLAKRGSLTTNRNASRPIHP